MLSLSLLLLNSTFCPVSLAFHLSRSLSISLDLSSSLSLSLSPVVVFVQCQIIPMTKDEVVNSAPIRPSPAPPPPSLAAETSARVHSSDLEVWVLHGSSSSRIWVAGCMSYHTSVTYIRVIHPYERAQRPCVAMSRRSMLPSSSSCCTLVTWKSVSEGWEVSVQGPWV